MFKPQAAQMSRPGRAYELLVRNKAMRQLGDADVIVELHLRRSYPS